MKNFFSLIFYSFSLAGYGQVNSVMPPEAELFYNHAMRTIKAEIKSTIEKNANNLKNKIVDSDSLSRSLRTDASLQNLTQQGIEAVTILIMVQISKNADADLKDMVVNRQKDTDHSEVVEIILSNKSLIATDVTDLMNELGSSRDMALDGLK